MASPTHSLTTNNRYPTINITSPSPVHACSSSMPTIIQTPPISIDRPRPLSRPPSYKLDTNVDLDALEREYEKIISTYRTIPKWRHQFQGVPLVFWLVAFVMMGVVSLFIPQLPTISLILWLPLVFYFISVLIVQIIYRRRTHALQQMKCQLAAIHQHRQYVLTQVVDCPSDLYFLHLNTNQHTNTVTTLLSPPPTYQKFA